MTKLNCSPVLIILFFFSFSFQTSAQTHDIKWGDVPPEHLRMITFEADTAAEAVVLYDYGKLTFDFRSSDPKTVLERHTRIKILKRSGFSYGDISIPYYSKDRHEQVNKVKAIIHNPDGSSQKLGKKDFFEEDIDGKWSKIKFTFPDLQEGSVIEYTYREESKGIFSLPEWYFQHEIPVVWSEYDLFIPKWYTYVTLKQGQFAVSTQTWQQGTYTVSYNDGVNRTNTSNINLEVNHITYAASNLPALREEAYITTMDDYRTRVRFQISGTNYEVYKPIMGDWKTTARKLMEDGSFGEQLNNERYFKDALKDLEPLLSGIQDPAEKVQVIYDFVNQKMEWNGDYGCFVREKLKDCYAQQSGHSGELNLLLLALLKANGIDAHPLMVSTRTNGRMTELYPILEQFNHTMAYVQLGGEWSILDAGNESRPMGIPRINALNGQAWVVNPSDPQWVAIDAEEGSSIYLGEFDLDEEGLLIGELKELHKGYNAVNNREEMDQHNCEKTVKEGYAKAFPDSEISKVTVEDAYEVNKPLSYATQLTIPDMAQSTGEFIYFSPILVKAFKENPFKIKKRTYPVDMPHPIKERYILKLRLPEDYAIEELPEPMRIKMAGGTSTFSYEVKELGGFLQIISSVSFKKSRYEPEEYAALQNFIDLIIEKQEEQIVLKLQE